MAKEGSTIGGLMDVIGMETSMGLQYGVPLLSFVDKFSHTRFEPSGWTRNPDIPNAKSVVDYIFRWLGMQFIPGFREANAPQRETTESADEQSASTAATPASAAQVPQTSVAVVSDFGTSTAADAEALDAESLSGPAVRSMQFAQFQSDAPACDNCGAITVRNGNCYLCHNCGNSMGCS
jgi:ribonucleoside-diphosphate reductase alpha chain